MTAVARARTRVIVAAMAMTTTAAVIGCATLAQPTTVDAAWAAEQWPGTTQADLARGRSLYVKRCAGCHALRQPERYPSSTWQHHVDEMAKRSALVSDERDLLLRFLVTMSRPQPSPPPAQPPTDPAQPRGS